MTAPTERAVQVAKAALMEAGRPDLAAGVYPSSAGWPSHALLGGWCTAGQHHGAEGDLMIKAFVLGHRAAGHEVAVYIDNRCCGLHLRWPVAA